MSEESVITMKATSLSVNREFLEDLIDGMINAAKQSGNSNNSFQTNYDGNEISLQCSGMESHTENDSRNAILAIKTDVVYQGEIRIWFKRRLPIS